jgi:LysM domain-containing protein
VAASVEGIMHRDKKVGLALAILLVSFVGAFFFRPESPRTMDNLPELQNARGLDDEIARRDKPPHPDSVEADRKSRASESRRLTDRSNKDRPVWELPEFLGKDSGRQTASRSKVIASKDPFDSNERPEQSGISPLDPPADDRAAAIPSGNTDWEIASNDATTSRQLGDDSKLSTAKPRIHVVTEGETLSSIAGKYLGSQARFLDIYQANKDQLNSPNDLKVGMKLTIPDRGGESKSTQSTRGTVQSQPITETTTKGSRPHITSPASKVIEKAVEPRETPSETPDKKPKFKPSKISPAIRRSADEEDQLDGKTLSQSPPEDLLEVDDGILAELERDTIMVK